MGGTMSTKKRLIIFAVAALLVSMSLLCDVTTAATPTTLTVSAPATVFSGQTFSVTGQLTANGTALPWKIITLQNSTDNVTWTTVTTKQNYADGTYAFMNLNEMVAHTLYYRTTYAGATSNVVSVTVTKVTKIPTTLTVSAPATVSPGQTFSVTGQLTANGTALPWKIITLQNSTDNVTWTTVTTKQNYADGTYAFMNLNEMVAHTLYYRTTYAGATSNVVSVTVDTL